MDGPRVVDADPVRHLKPLVKITMRAPFLSAIFTSSLWAAFILPCLAQPNDPQRLKLWSIGLASGPDPLHLVESVSSLNPVFTWHQINQPTTAFVADPFVIREGNRWQLFFELFNTTSERGEIGFAESEDLVSWRYKGVVLAEPFHLSYPFVFEHNGEHYMIPETRGAKGIRLYKARRYPRSWKLERTLIAGEYTDASPVFYQGRWWIFACLSPYSLAIFSADNIRGPWRAHPGNPFYPDDKSRARPGGRPVVVDGKLIRFVQDNREGYGKRVRAMVVDTLTSTEFQEHVADPDPLFGPHGEHWAWNGMHHVAPVQLSSGSWVAAIDGNGDGKVDPPQ